MGVSLEKGKSWILPHGIQLTVKTIIDVKDPIDSTITLQYVILTNKDNLEDVIQQRMLFFGIQTQLVYLKK